MMFAADPPRSSLSRLRGLGLSLSLLACAGLACHRGGGQTEPIEDGGGAGGEAGPQAGDPADEGGEVEAQGYPGELISTELLDGEFLARQKLDGTFGERKFAFEAVLQLRGGTLTVLGLTPFGTKAFVLTQTGTEVDFQPLIDREMPFPPEYILQDIHRAWLWGARLPWGNAPPTGQEQARAEVAGEAVTETWTANGLVRRSFERLDGEPAGEIRIDYIGGHRQGRPAKEAVLHNGWFGYDLRIQTIEWRSL